MFHFIKWKWDPIKNEIPRGFHHCSNSEIENGKQKVLKPFRFQDFFWSEWRDLNSRPLDPQSSALPTALHPDICFWRSRVSLYILTRLIKKSNPYFRFFSIFLIKWIGNVVDKIPAHMVSYPSAWGCGLSCLFMERCPSGWRNRSWKPATRKRPWVRIPLSPPI